MVAGRIVANIPRNDAFKWERDVERRPKSTDRCFRNVEEVLVLCPEKYMFEKSSKGMRSVVLTDIARSTWSEAGLMGRGEQPDLGP